MKLPSKQLSTLQQHINYLTTTVSVTWTAFFGGGGGEVEKQTRFKWFQLWNILRMLLIHEHEFKHEKFGMVRR